MMEPSDNDSCLVFAWSRDKFHCRLHVHGYRGNAGDSMTLGEDHDNQPFSTHDRDHDSRFYDNCAEHYHGAWWFKSCFQSHLNGRYYTKVSAKHRACVASNFT